MHVFLFQPSTENKPWNENKRGKMLTRSLNEISLMPHYAIFSALLWVTNAENLQNSEECHELINGGAKVAYLFTLFILSVSFLFACHHFSVIIIFLNCLCTLFSILLAQQFCGRGFPWLSMRKKKRMELSCSVRTMELVFISLNCVESRDFLATFMPVAALTLNSSRTESRQQSVDRFAILIWWIG